MLECVRVVNTRMKLFVLFAVFGFLGAALGDQEGGGDINTQDEIGDASSEITCLTTPETQEEPSTRRGYVDIAAECISIEKTGLDMHNLTTIEEFRKQATLYCLDLQDIRSCLTNVSKMSEKCHNQGEHQRFQIFVGMLESFVDIVCREDGSKLAVICYGSSTMPPEDDVFARCVRIMEYNTPSVGLPGSKSSAKIRWLYRQIGLAKECFESGLQEEEVKNAVVSLMDEMRSRMNCIHDEDQSTVLCTTIIDQN